jgi:hypothetical protein
VAGRASWALTDAETAQLSGHAFERFATFAQFHDDWFKIDRAGDGAPPSPLVADASRFVQVRGRRVSVAAPNDAASLGSRDRGLHPVGYHYALLLLRSQLGSLLEKGIYLILLLVLTQKILFTDRSRRVGKYWSE